MKSMRTVAAVLALVACVHAGMWALLRPEGKAPNFTGQLASVSYSPFADSQHPDYGDRPTAEQIRADLKAIAPYTRAIRTYSATGGAELVPPIAAEFGLKVTVGAWIDKDQARNEREIRSALDLARHYSNVNAIVVGNETTLRAEMSVDDLIKLIQKVKRASPVPVTTGEIWTVWIDHPELASAVDFIAAHILPYWEGFDASHAVDHTIEFYDKLRRMHPGKRIVIAEFGWPSAGYNFHDADPGRIDQAMVIRDFVNRAEAYGIDYNIVEAIDQPWKTMEGGVGPYWGLFDASRQAKFSWTGPISDPDYIKRAGLAVLLGLLLSLPILAVAGVSATQALLLAVSANAVGAWFSAIVAFWKGHYFVPGAAFALGLGIVLLIPLVAIALSRIEEIAAIAFGRPPRRLAVAPPLVAGSLRPQGLDPCTGLLRAAGNARPPRSMPWHASTTPMSNACVVINNTPDPSLWQPVEEHCRKLGERFKFVRIDKLVGYKAGALRLALAHTAPDAEIIGSIDADYVVHPDWLKDLVPLFADARVGFVQSPQDHRDGDRSLMHAAMNAEYSGFFDIGMVQRNEINAIVMHGTMCLIRRAAIESAGGWSSDTIVEDTDLGLAFLEHGWSAHYTNRRYGHGLLPDTFEAYKRQRHRWASAASNFCANIGASCCLAPTGSRASRSANTASAGSTGSARNSIGVVVALLNIVWVPVVAFANIAVPGPHPDAADHRRLHGLGRTFRRALSPAGEGNARPNGRRGCAAMSLQWTVARAVAWACSMNACRSCAPPRAASDAKARISRRSGRRLSRPPPRRRAHPGSDQLQAGPRDQYFRLRPRGAKPAVPLRVGWPRSRAPALTASSIGKVSGSRSPSCFRSSPVISQVLASQVLASQVLAEPAKLPAENQIEAAQ